LAAPRSSSSCTIARPKPRLPPVTSATAPSIGVPCELVFDIGDFLSGREF
jgi:hypothetical protein